MINSSVNQVIYNGNGVAREFAYSFVIIDKSDLHLTLVDTDGTETAITTDYYVDANASKVYYPGYAPGAEPPEADQPPVLATGQKLIIYRDVPITQLSSLSDVWPFNVIEKMGDKGTIIDQQLKADVDRSVKTSRAASSSFDNTIPVPTDNNNHGIRITKDGLELVNDPSEVYDDTVAIKNQAEAAKLSAQNAASVAQGYAQVCEEFNGAFENVATMKSATDLVEGMVVRTAGYYSANDGGGALYVIKASTTKYAETLTNGLKAELIVKNEINVVEFGIMPDSVSDNVMSNNVIKFNQLITLGYKIVFPKGVFNFNGRLNLTNASYGCYIIEGAGEDSKINFIGAGAGFYEEYGSADDRNYHPHSISNLWLNGDLTNIGFENKSLKITFNNITFTNFNIGLYIHDGGYSCYYNNLLFNHNIYGTKIENTTTTEFFNCDWENSANAKGAGIYLNGNMSTTKIHGTIEGNTSVGLWYGSNFYCNDSLTISVYFEANGNGNNPAIKYESANGGKITYDSCYMTSTDGYSYDMYLGDTVIVKNSVSKATKLIAKKIYFENTVLQGISAVLPDVISDFADTVKLHNVIGNSGTNGACFKIPCVLKRGAILNDNTHPDAWSENGVGIKCSSATVTQDTTEKLFGHNSTKMSLPAGMAAYSTGYIRPDYIPTKVRAGKRLAISFYAKATEPITYNMYFGGTDHTQISRDFTIGTKWEKFLFINSPENIESNRNISFDNKVACSNAVDVNITGISIVTDIDNDDIGYVLTGYSSL